MAEKTKWQFQELGRAFLRSRAWTFLMLALACLPFLPFLFMGANSHYHIHDSLDSDVPMMRAIADHGDLFHLSGNMEYLMDGTPRSCARSGYNLTFLLFGIFNTPVALFLNYVLSHLVAFAGMYLLLRRHLIREAEFSWLPPVIATLFSAVSWFSTLGWFVAAQPLLYYSFLNLRNQQQKWYDWVIIAMFPFTSPLVLIAPFILVVLGAGLVWTWWETRKLPLIYLAGLGVLTTGFLLADFGMVWETFFAKSFVSHRTEWALPESQGFSAAFRQGISTVFFTHFHAGQFLTRLILGAWVIVLSIYATGIRIPRWFYVIPATIVLICMIQAFMPLMVRALGDKISLLRTVQLDRFYNLLPCLWLILFALLVREIFRVPQLRLLAVGLLAAQWISIHKENKELTETVKALTGKPHEPSVREFLAADQFAGVRDYIGKPQEAYKVVSLGIPPGVALHNGFHCLDGYMSNYPLEYKHKFRKAIENELNKSPEAALYFDQWGNRCYLTAAEINGNFWAFRHLQLKVHTLATRNDLLKEMGAQYLISAVELQDPGSSGFALEKYFPDPGSAWEIYLYRIL